MNILKTTKNLCNLFSEKRLIYDNLCNKNSMPFVINSHIIYIYTHGRTNKALSLTALSPIFPLSFSRFTAMVKPTASSSLFGVSIFCHFLLLGLYFTGTFYYVGEHFEYCFNRI